MVAGAAALVVVAVIAAVVLAGGGDGDARGSLADASPYDGRSPREPSAAGTRVIVRLPRPSLGAAGIAEPGAQRDYIASLEDEGAALRSALEARGIRLSGVRTYTRAFNGFAATVRTGDLAELPSLGVSAQPVRRFYPASAEPARVRGLRAPTAAAPLGGASIAVLDTGIDTGHPLLAGRLDPGYDAVDEDDDPAPGRAAPGERSGTALAGVLAAAGERVLPIRIAASQPAAAGTGSTTEDVAITDQLLAGLERAVDPDGDGATDDHVPVALVGVNSPYAGFADSPEAEAVRGAARLGTLVVAPAGGEGAAAGSTGTIGSPASAPASLAAGALAAPGAVARIELSVGDADAGAVLLAGAPPARALDTAGPVDTTDPAQLEVDGRLAVVAAGENPVARATAAAAAGAGAVLLADPRDRPLPAIPAGRIAVPVLGVTGAAAAAVLEEDAGARAAFGAVTAPAPPAVTLAGDAAAPALAPYSSRGPAAAGGLKPELAAPGAALTALPGGGAAVVGGTAIAAARAALEAAQLVRDRPSASPRELRTVLAQAATPVPSLPSRGAGAGVLTRPGAGAGLAAEALPPGGDPCAQGPACARIALANQGATELELALAVQPDGGTRATVLPDRLRIPPGAERQVEIAITARGLGSGRLVARAAGGVVLSQPFQAAEPAPPPLGELTLRRARGAVAGVAFTLGAFERGDPLGAGTRVELAESLTLTLVRPGRTRALRRLTPPGGARELLPAEYAYTLPRATLRSLGRGRYAFRVVARSPRGGRAAIATSEPFAR